MLFGKVIVVQQLQPTGGMPRRVVWRWEIGIGLRMWAGLMDMPGLAQFGLRTRQAGLSAVSRVSVHGKEWGEPTLEGRRHGVGVAIRHGPGPGRFDQGQADDLTYRKPMGCFYDAHADGQHQAGDQAEFDQAVTGLPV